MKIPQLCAEADGQGACPLVQALARQLGGQCGLARNHGSVGGNKRTAWIAARLFLADNGYRLSFDPLDAIRIMEDVAGGIVTETELAAWFRNRLL